ncbi:MAG: ATP-binding cassette domain-containing protein, partial [Lautropia sp.]
ILKLRGYYLAMASLALQLMLIFLATEWVGLTGGALGTTGIPRFSTFGFSAHDDLTFYYFCWGFVGLAAFIGRNIDRSRIGRSLRAIAGSEIAAASSAIDIQHYKLMMFVTSAGMASVAGSLTAHYLSVMEPQVFGYQYSITVITAAIVGGLQSIWGGVIGAVAIVAMREGLKWLALPLWEVVAMGALTVVVLIVLPQGISGLIGALRKEQPGDRPSSIANGDPSPPYSLSMTGSSASNTSNRSLLSLKGVSKSFGNLQALQDVGFDLRQGSITAVIGPNGAGKSTMFGVISGIILPDRGEVTLGDTRIETLSASQIANLGLSRTFQHVQLFDGLTVLENVMCGGHRGASSRFAAVVLRLPSVQREEGELAAHAFRCLDFVGMADAAHRLPGQLSFGHQRLVEVARALASRPALLILDEPASGLTSSETEALACLLIRIRSLGTTVMLVEHDVRMVMGVADHLIVLDRGRLLADGAPERVRHDPAVIAAYLGA